MIGIHEPIAYMAHHYIPVVDQLVTNYTGLRWNLFL